MNRRTLLAWLSRGLGSASAALVGIPGLWHLVRSLRPDVAAAGSFQRLLRLDDLPPEGQPVEVPVVGARRDAWITYPEQTLGRVWLVRLSAVEGAADPVRVAAFTAICPHLGCAVQMDRSGRGFLCPCHRATFDLQGQRTKSTGEANSSPRDMDQLECRVVQDAGSAVWWVEVRYQTFKNGLASKIAIT